MQRYREELAIYDLGYVAIAMFRHQPERFLIMITT